MTKIHRISTAHLSVDKLQDIIENGYKLELSDESKALILKCRNYLDNKLKNQEEPIYGVSTGFGCFCDISVNSEQLSVLQRNLVVSHACGTGDRVPNEIVKLMLFLKIQSLSYGYSGVQLATVQRLVDFYNNGVFPVVYQQGSLGASGDLAPLAHISLPILGLGEVNYKGRDVPAQVVNEKFGWEAITLQSKEGLALLNGTQFMAAYGCWCIMNAKRLSDAADVTAAISIDAYDGSIDPFHPAVHAIRPHKGQIETACRIRELLAGSEIISRKKVHVQDPYSFRCVPQVHGAAKDTLNYVENVFTTEINSATDNPMIVPDEDLIISAGNFHGEPLALALDFLAIGMAELGSISAQRIYRLIAGKRDLPVSLAGNPGLNSGFMIPQYTAASIVSQSKQLCTPASVDSIESSNGQEDHVSMGANAATKCYRVVENTERILAIELFTATQALDFRRPLRSSPILEMIAADYRMIVPFIENDCVMYTYMRDSVEFLRNEKF
ncbi:MAG: histidine ammonia-lyase [Parabacteroides sp.]|jgi:histidine ammonia-lyase|nr:histidine ammonia-lyase [Parabacteroides sp.]